MTNCTFTCRSYAQSEEKIKLPVKKYRSRKETTVGLEDLVGSGRVTERRESMKKGNRWKAGN